MGLPSYDDNFEGYEVSEHSVLYTSSSHDM